MGWCGLSIPLSALFPFTFRQESGIRNPGTPKTGQQKFLFFLSSFHSLIANEGDLTVWIGFDWVGGFQNLSSFRSLRIPRVYHIIKLGLGGKLNLGFTSKWGHWHGNGYGKIGFGREAT
jgi:hypothetical protein